MGLLDFFQGASNAAAGNVSGPVDAIAWALRKAGVPVGDAPMGGSQWMAQMGLTRPANGYAGLLGEAAGLSMPIVAAAKAPQIARGLLSLDDKAMDMARQGVERAMLANGGIQPATNWKEYGIDHRPMSDAGGAARLHDLTASFGDDVYGPNALQYFGSGDAREKAVLQTLKALRGKPDAMVTIYRGIPEGARGGINAGDWVTLSPNVAKEYGLNVVKMRVPASHVTSWPDSLLEFGYFPPNK